MNDHSKTCNALKYTLSAEIYMQMWKVYLFCLTINKTCIILCISWLGIREGVNLQDEFRKKVENKGIDSTELIMALEEEFDTEIPDADAEKIVTVSDVVDYIKDHVA